MCISSKNRTEMYTYIYNSVLSVYTEMILVLKIEMKCVYISCLYLLLQTVGNNWLGQKGGSLFVYIKCNTTANAFSSTSCNCTGDACWIDKNNF